MDLSVTPLTSHNLRRCLPFWCTPGAYSSQEIERAALRAAALLETGAARGVLISERSGRPRCYGLTVFVSESFADGYLAHPHPLLGKRLLLDDSTAILDDEAIGRRNAGAGLQMVVVGQNWDDTGIPPQAYDDMVAALVAGFFDIHRGFRLSRIINEVIGEPMIHDVGSSGAFALCRHMRYAAPDGSHVRSLLAVIDRQQALASRGLLLPMFSYVPPEVCFTGPERDLLRAALAGSTDTQLAERLGIAVSAVKARWNRIHARVRRQLPGLLPAAGPSATRGAQVRHLVLEFVRAHPSELAPYARHEETRRLRWAAPARRHPFG